MASFSRAGENYWNGGRRVLEVGNTDLVAGMIADLVDVDTYRIEAAEPYPFGYEPTVERNWAEVQADARPAIARSLPPVGVHDVVLLGSPVWAMQEPMIMRTFIDGMDAFAGVTVLPFVTYAVSGFGSVLDDYARLCPDATLGQGLAIRGEEAADALSSVRSWLSAVGML
ncbi:flavodoxin [Demequina sp. NBRC 110056]|uniref:flavodoxin n=1 Tax=Demequina sp. NBRC 110056 TaxID=1570345 RepID=UPI001F3C90CD|nr:flavodoxin [Demequina sp. NBRC 110056]